MVPVFGVPLVTVMLTGTAPGLKGWVVTNARVDGLRTPAKTDRLEGEVKVVVVKFSQPMQPLERMNPDGARVTTAVPFAYPTAFAVIVALPVELTPCT
jgi:hypothetical protein